jgi:tRNA-intron endonuclease
VSKIVKKLIKGKKSKEGPYLSGDRVVISEEQLAQRLFSKAYGEIKKSMLYLNLYEASLLLEEGKLEVYKCGKPLSLEKLMQEGERLNEGFAMKYDVFKDLRIGKGLIVRSGIKFGCDFVVYPKGKSVGKSHSKWMVHVLPECSRVDYNELTRAARLATNVKKNMLFASVTERGPVYYEISRAKL